MLASMFALILALPTRALAPDPPPKHHWIWLACGGGTVDVWISVAGSQCFDRFGTRYTAVYGGTGLGGIVAVSAFTFIARVREGRGIEGHYTGASVSGAWKWGAGAGVFTRNQDGEGHQKWLPSRQTDEFVVWLAGHRGYAADLSGLTLTILKH